MQQYMRFLGKTVRDKITGAEGVVTSISFDLYGRVQSMIKRPIDKDGRVPDSFWHDIKRVEIIDNKEVMPVPNFGACQQAPEVGAGE